MHHAKVRDVTLANTDVMLAANKANMAAMAALLLNNSSEATVDELLKSLYTPEAINANAMLSEDDSKIPAAFLGAGVLTLSCVVYNSSAPSRLLLEMESSRSCWLLLSLC